MTFQVKSVDREKGTITIRKTAALGWSELVSQRLITLYSGTPTPKLKPLVAAVRSTRQPPFGKTLLNPQLKV